MAFETDRRPNTQVPAQLIREKIILCPGEDPGELRRALLANGFKRPRRSHEFRCYKFWDYGQFTVVWCGIGSGCVEPLMWELLAPGTPVKEIVLVGTAGIVETDPDLCGKVFAVSRAFGGAVGVGACQRGADGAHTRSSWLGHDCSWPVLDQELEQAESISSDYYYGNSIDWPDRRIGKVQELDPALAEAVRFTWKRGRLLEMEVTPFYLLAQAYGPSGLKYVAVKGVSNLYSQHDSQVDLAQPALDAAVGWAAKLLQVGR